MAVGLLMCDGARVERVRSERDDTRWEAALGRLGRDAERAVAEGPWTVTAKDLVPPSGDRRDYCTLSEYFWPDPDHPDGLPWVLRDGHINPAATSSTRDADQLRHMSHGARTLTLAGALLDRPDLSAAGASVLRTWFLDDTTAMRPHLRYASLIPGRDEPPGWGLIRAHPFLYALDAATLATAAGALDENETAALRQWFAEFLDWVLASTMWAEERSRGNNHTTWCLALVLGTALWLDRGELAAGLASTVEEAVLDQVEPDGLQPRERARSRSYFYCCFNLDGLATLADLATAAGVDCWSAGAVVGERLRAAARWLAPWLEDPDRWPDPFHIEWDRTHGASPLHRVAARSPEAGDLREWLARVPVARQPSAREWLLWDSRSTPGVAP